MGSGEAGSEGGRGCEVEVGKGWRGVAWGGAVDWGGWVRGFGGLA